MSSMNQERAAGVTMALTYAVGALGLGLGFYMAGVTAFKALRSSAGHPGEWRTVLPAGAFAAMLIVIGAAGMSALP